ncbi:MAG TPA: DMT family transporter [Clostridia bacterium]|nr:DMT family transporter [Clostridia bacterium]
MLRENSNKTGYVYLLITVLLFSTYEVVSKTLVGKVNPFEINFIRFTIGGVILFAVLFIKSDYKIGMTDFIWTLILGVLNVVASMNLLQLSLYVKGAQASVTAVIFSSNPIFVALFAAYFEKEKLNIYKIIGLLMGVAGISAIFFNKLRAGFTDFRSPLLALSSALLFGLYTVLGRKVSMRIGSIKMNAYSFISGALVLMPILLIFNIPIVYFKPSGIIQVVYLSVLCTGIAYITYFRGLEIVGASKGSLVYFLKPVLASLIAIIFLNEHPSINLFIGTALIICGIFFVIYMSKREKLRT